MEELNCIQCGHVWMGYYLSSYTCPSCGWHFSGGVGFCPTTWALVQLALQYPYPINFTPNDFVAGVEQQTEIILESTPTKERNFFYEASQASQSRPQDP